MSSVPGFNEGSWSGRSGGRTSSRWKSSSSWWNDLGNGKDCSSSCQLAQGHRNARMCGTAGCIPAWSQAAGGALAAVARSKRHSKAQNQLLKCKDLKEKLTFLKRKEQKHEPGQVTIKTAQGENAFGTKSGILSPWKTSGIFTLLSAIICKFRAEVSHCEFISPSVLNEIILSSKSCQKIGMRDVSALWFTNTHKGIKVGLELLQSIVSHG